MNNANDIAELRRRCDAALTEADNARSYAAWLRSGESSLVPEDQKFETPEDNDNDAEENESEAAFLNRILASLDELNWYKNILAEELGYDGPAGDGANPLRDALQELNRLRAEPTVSDLRRALAAMSIDELRATYMAACDEADYDMAAKTGFLAEYGYWLTELEHRARSET